MSVKNSELTVSTSIESILRQSYTNYEFLIIDEGKLDRFNGDLIDYRKIILNGSKKLPKKESHEEEIEPKIDKKQAKQIKTEILFDDFSFSFLFIFTDSL